MILIKNVLNDDSLIQFQLNINGFLEFIQIFRYINSFIYSLIRVPYDVCSHFDKKCTEGFFKLAVYEAYKDKDITAEDLLVMH